MAVPPQLLQLLAAHQAAGASMPPDISPAPPPGIGAPAGSGQQNPEAEPIRILRMMIQLAQRYQQVEPDEADKVTMAKLLATLQQYLAKDQADVQKLIGGGPMARVLRHGAPQGGPVGP